MTSLTDLIHRLEQAEEGSRELDLFIHLLSNDQPGNPPIDTYSRYDGGEFIFEYGDQRIGVWGSHVVPHYTTSIDAALTLVPEGWSYSIDGPKGFVTVNPDNWASPEDTILAQTATPALTLCIAALKARSAAQDPQQG